MNQRIEKVVIDGGPCGGKTKGVPIIKEHFKKLGWLVLISVESPTRLYEELSYEPGVNITIPDFQKLVLESEIKQEEALMERARTSGCEKVLILCDRGRFGGLGYQDHEDFYRMARFDFGQSMKDLYDYSGCVFLQSLAVDKPEVYLEHMRNNSARRETDVESARKQNNRSLEACVGVGRMFIIDNSTSFEEKMARTVKVVEHFLSGQEFERKFVSPTNETLDDFAMPKVFSDQKIRFVSCQLTQAYLRLKDEDVAQGLKTRRVRAKRFNTIRALSMDSFYDEPESHILTLKGPKKAGGGSEVEEEIKERLYLTYMEEELDPKRIVVWKTRYYFVYEGRYWELDIFEKPKGQRFILELEHLPGEDLSQIKVPEFVGLTVDGTDDPMNTNQFIAETV